MGGWMALGLAVAADAATRRVEASATAAELSSAVLEMDEALVVCSGDCPPGVGRVSVSAPGLGLAGTAIEVRARVGLDLAVVGHVDGDVACAVLPELREGGRVGALGRGCRLTALSGSWNPWVRAGVVATVETALSAILDEQLRTGDYDLLSGARDGVLAPYGRDPALAAPKAKTCVQAIRSIGVREQAVVVGVDVGC
jgi:hypothetical protein